ncbi:MAG: hypothetical protein M3277_12170 [Actinomycetota bacterium]|nr:hypothetical protein [Actinomycetota bacterium]
MGTKKGTLHRTGSRARATGVVAAALAASVAPSGDVAAAGRSKCFGRRPTIVVNRRGHSRVVGTRGRDVILVGRGRATIRSKGGDDLICGGRRRDRIRAGAGDDRVTARGGADNVGGGKGFDRITGGGGNDRLWGGTSTDRIRGNAGDDAIRLGEGRLESDYGQLARGGSGNDEIYGSDVHERIYGGNGDDRIFGFEGAAGDVFGVPDYLVGGDGSDHVVAGTAPDEAPDPYGTFSFGGSGDDVLEDLDGVATLDGGPGDDELKAAQGHCCTGLAFTDAPAVHVDLTAGVATGDGTDTITGDVGSVVGSAFDDTLVGDDGDATFSGKAGNDTIEAGPGDDAVVGGPGDDRLDGGTGEDRLRIVDADEAVTIDLQQGTSTGEGADRLFGLENVWLTGNGDDVIRGDEGPNRITWSGFGPFEGVIEGRGGDDGLTFYGDGTIDAGAGDDRVVLFHISHARVDAGDGDDRMWVFSYSRPARPVALDGGAGDDTVDFSQNGGSPVHADLAAGTAHILGDESPRYGLTAIEALIGTQWYDVLLGDDGPNRLIGGNRDDRIEGRGGDDHLDGGDDVDTLDGGDGTDTCVNGERVSACEA